jgi:hypothetical protein
MANPLSTGIKNLKGRHYTKFYNRLKRWKARHPDATKTEVDNMTAQILADREAEWIVVEADWQAKTPRRTSYRGHKLFYIDGCPEALSYEDVIEYPPSTGVLRIDVKAAQKIRRGMVKYKRDATGKFSGGVIRENGGDACKQEVVDLEDGEEEGGGKAGQSNGDIDTDEDDAQGQLEGGFGFDLQTPNTPTNSHYINTPNTSNYPQDVPGPQANCLQTPPSTVGTRTPASLGQYPSERNYYHRVGSHSPVANRPLTSYHPIAGSHYNSGGLQAAPTTSAASFTYQQDISPQESTAYFTGNDGSEGDSIEDRFYLGDRDFDALGDQGFYGMINSDTGRLFLDSLSDFGPQSGFH